MTRDKSSSAVLTPAEVADLFRVTPDAVRQWAQDGKLPYFVTPGGHRRFRRSDVDALASDVTGDTAA